MVIAVQQRFSIDKKKISMLLSTTLTYEIKTSIASTDDKKRIRNDLNISSKQMTI